MCDDDTLNICQFERNPHYETTIRARFNPKHIDERVRIVKETTGKIPQTVRRNVSWWGCERLKIGKSFGRVVSRKVSTIVIKGIVIILDLLHQTIWWDIHVEKKGYTYWSKRVGLSWDNLGTSNVPMNVHIWNLCRILCNVSQ